MYRVIRWVLACFWLIVFGHLLIGFLPDNASLVINWAAVVLAALHLAEMWFFKARIQAASNPKLEALLIFLFGIAQGLDTQDR